MKGRNFIRSSSNPPLVGLCGGSLTLGLIQAEGQTGTLTCAGEMGSRTNSQVWQENRWVWYDTYDVEQTSIKHFLYEDPDAPAPRMTSGVSNINSFPGSIQSSDPQCPLSASGGLVIADTEPSKWEPQRAFCDLPAGSGIREGWVKQGATNKVVQTRTYKKIRTRNYSCGGL